MVRRRYLAQLLRVDIVLLIREALIKIRIVGSEVGS